MKEFNYCILIIAFILAALQLNVYTNVVSSYLIFYVLSYSYFKNFNKALLYALFLLVFFNVTVNSPAPMKIAENTIIQTNIFAMKNVDLYTGRPNHSNKRTITE